MAQIQSDKNNRQEGQSSYNYGYWKNRMNIHILGIMDGLWDIIENVCTLETDKLDATQIKENNSLIKLASAKGIFYNGLDRTEYNKLFICTTTYLIWTRLWVIHDGTSQIKKTRIYILKTKYEIFNMLPFESISNMFTSFTDTTNQMQGLGYIFNEEDLVVKVIYSLHSDYLQNRMTIEDSHDLASITFEDLMKNSWANM